MGAVAASRIADRLFAGTADLQDAAHAGTPDGRCSWPEERIMKDLLVPVSPGELLDKITILRIKVARIQDAAKLANVKLELALLEKTWEESGCAVRDVSADERALQAVNERLWDIEDFIRDKEARQTFDRDFIELARSVYVCNDERAEIKKRVNLALGSRLIEEKSYKQYR
jgi:hypothetical protein